MKNIKVILQTLHTHCESPLNPRRHFFHYFVPVEVSPFCCWEELEGRIRCLRAYKPGRRTYTPVKKKGTLPKWNVNFNTSKDSILPSFMLSALYCQTRQNKIHSVLIKKQNKQNTTPKQQKQPTCLSNIAIYSKG